MSQKPPFGLAMNYKSREPLWIQGFFLFVYIWTYRNNET
jgi:hypothetical protein